MAAFHEVIVGLAADYSLGVGSVAPPNGSSTGRVFFQVKFGDVISRTSLDSGLMLIRLQTS